MPETKSPNDHYQQQNPPKEEYPSLLSHLTSPRSRKQLGLFFAGAGFFTLSTLITRRSLVRRYKASIPSFYQPSTRPNANVDGAMEAFQALNIATINVASAAMMVTGGALWAMDISSMDDLRRKVRGGLGVDGTGRSEQDAEEEFEEWLATVLARKDDKERKIDDRKGKGKDSRDRDQEASR
ncbi:MAG: hypothetical protein M1837_000487 [Sclerophora amabilis]|nr:MAG: hypothetical protein M1837_000487 [Sclerophora amabilis]